MSAASDPQTFDQAHFGVMTGGDHALLLPAMNSSYAISLPYMVLEGVRAVVQTQTENNE